MTKPDDDLQKHLFNEVKWVEIHIEDICNDSKNTIINVMMKLNFLNKIRIKFIVEMKKINIIMIRGKN